MSELIIYEDGDFSIEISIDEDTLWLSAEQIATIFGVNRPAIVKHIGNIYKTDELDKNSTCSILEQVAKDGKKRKMNFYNLDMIIASGYRVNSKKATSFRRWASNILKDHLLKGYTLNQKRLQQKGLEEFNQAIALLQTTINQENLACDEAKGLLDVIVSYGRSWSLLEGYDEDNLSMPTYHNEHKFVLGYSEAKNAIAQLKKELMKKGEASELFGREKAGEFDGIVGNVYQTFGGDDLIPSVEAKASNLLYYIIKDHPFVDGNKRIGAFLFILFLQKNKMLYRANGEAKINDNALVALTLMTAKSLPEQKDTVVALIVNMLVESI
ncbi:MAG: Putative DNA-binding protein in cluster with Type I restriction-modification system [uncultured Sulfurovum sp.]|uniref:DNA-binding protein in cluster with Type I restriction-modification system n=1 Tax=uncultured Sulfurovum sp. TaxID=269237 RepID=A0A6S6TAK4_9BACT|nr:MAG: Putative DNA-binding protein in cluster with Type I restriction-modification system [uncultured Sulfurovum sp.]